MSSSCYKYLDHVGKIAISDFTDKEVKYDIWRSLSLRLTGYLSFYWLTAGPASPTTARQ